MLQTIRWTFFRYTWMNPPFFKPPLVGDGPNMVSESTVSNIELRECLGAHRVPWRELSEFLSTDYLCAKANSSRFSQNSPSLPKSSLSSLFQNSALETVFCPFLCSSQTGVVLNAVGCRNMQMITNERKRAQTQVWKKSAKGRKGAQKSASAQKLLTTRFETTRFGNSQVSLYCGEASAPKAGVEAGKPTPLKPEPLKPPPLRPTPLKPPTLKLATTPAPAAVPPAAATAPAASAP